MGECNMVKAEKRQKKPKTETRNIEEYVKQMPPPPKEHTYELKMEKLLKHMLREQEKKEAKKNSS
jgi:hypothetical protein